MWEIMGDIPNKWYLEMFQTWAKTTSLCSVSNACSCARSGSDWTSAEPPGPYHGVAMDPPMVWENLPGFPPLVIGFPISRHVQYIHYHTSPITNLWWPPKKTSLKRWTIPLLKSHQENARRIHNLTTQSPKSSYQRPDPGPRELFPPHSGPSASSVPPKSGSPHWSTVPPEMPWAASPAAESHRC